MNCLENLRTKIYADGASWTGMLEMYKNPWIQGFTTNPSLMRKDGVTDYVDFARKLAAEIPDRPLSFEVISDDFAEMERQALLISGWGDNIYVKIPVSNTRGEASYPLIRSLAAKGVKLNVTAIMTIEQVKATSEALANGPSSLVSVFAGRIADSGRDPMPVMKEALEILRPYPRQELLWASTRELLNIMQADAIGCHIITVTNDILAKLGNLGRDLHDYSLATVKMFYDDARKAGFSL